MALASVRFQTYSDLVLFVNTNGLAKATILKIDTDAISGGWVIWHYGATGATQTLHAKHFMRHSELAAFVNTTPIAAANVLKIDADPGNGGYCLFWYS